MKNQTTVPWWVRFVSTIALMVTIAWTVALALTAGIITSAWGAGFLLLVGWAMCAARVSELQRTGTDEPERERTPNRVWHINIQPTDTVPSR